MISHGCFHLPTTRMNSWTHSSIVSARTEKKIIPQTVVYSFFFWWECAIVSCCFRLFVITLLPHFCTPTLCHNAATNPSSFFSLSLSRYAGTKHNNSSTSIEFIRYHIWKRGTKFKIDCSQSKREKKNCLPLNFIENWRRKYVQNKQIIFC